MHGRQELETEKNHTEKTPLSALVIIHEERGGVKSRLFWKIVSLRGLTGGARARGAVCKR
jgi:hypothetical protein